MANYLRGFWQIDLDNEPDEGAREAAEFLAKKSSEGGLSGFLQWGGVGAFPEPLQAVAKAYEQADEALRTAVREWAAERGVAA